jgi:GT2 family glycosyltransferase
MKGIVSVIIPTYNRKNKLKACIESLLNQTYIWIEIVVIDDCSTDGTIEMLENDFNSVKVLVNANNSGVAYARNKGFNSSTGEYICFVDSDNILKGNAIEELLNTMLIDKSIGFIGPKMYYLSDPKRIWYAGSDISLLTSRTIIYGLNEIDSGQFDQTRDVMQIPNMWMTKRSVVEKIGLINEEYVIHYEESDWAMRALNFGYRVVYCPSSVTYHDIQISKSIFENIGSRDLGDRVYFYGRNRAIFMKKYATKLNYFIFMILFNNIFMLTYVFIYLKNGRLDLARSFIRGYLSSLSKH